MSVPQANALISTATEQHAGTSVERQRHHHVKVAAQIEAQLPRRHLLYAHQIAIGQIHVVVVHNHVANGSARAFEQRCWFRYHRGASE